MARRRAPFSRHSARSRSNAGIRRVITKARPSTLCRHLGRPRRTSPASRAFGIVHAHESPATPRPARRRVTPPPPFLGQRRHPRGSPVAFSRRRRPARRVPPRTSRERDQAAAEALAQLLPPARRARGRVLGLAALVVAAWRRGPLVRMQMRRTCTPRRRVVVRPWWRSSPGRGCPGDVLEVLAGPSRGARRAGASSGSVAGLRIDGPARRRASG